MRTLRVWRLLCFCEGEGLVQDGRYECEEMDADTVLNEEERILVFESFKHEKE